MHYELQGVESCYFQKSLILTSKLPDFNKLHQIKQPSLSSPHYPTIPQITSVYGVTYGICASSGELKEVWFSGDSFFDENWKFLVFKDFFHNFWLDGRILKCDTIFPLGIQFATSFVSVQTTYYAKKLIFARFLFILAAFLGTFCKYGLKIKTLFGKEMLIVLFEYHACFLNL